MSEHTIVKYGFEFDLSYEHKTFCPRCVNKGRDTSSDNFHIYGLDKNNKHQGGHCFCCEYTIPSEQWLEDNTEVDENMWENYVSREFNPEVAAEIKNKTNLDSKGFRGIRKETGTYFGVRYSYNDDGSIKEVYYPTTKNSELSGYKVRVVPKQFDAYGVVGKDCDLFGQFRFKNSNGKYCVICAGEHDQLAAYQMLKDYQDSRGYEAIPVVSSTIGESGSHRQIQAQYEWLDQFERIIICYDMDDAGKEATEKVVNVLPKGKAFIMSLPMKDPNDMLLAGKEKEFINCFFKAKPYVPAGVKSAADGIEEIGDELRKPRITLPSYMHKMQDMMGGGIIQGRIGNIIADTSVGKSVHVNRMVYHWIFNSPVTPTIISLEATAAQYMLEMLSVHMEVNLLWKMTTEELLAFLETPEGQRVSNELAYKPTGEPRFFIIDDRAGSIKDMEKELEMLYKKFDSRLFVIDVLTDLLRGSNEQYSEDHMNFQRNMAKNGITILNVLHTRKPPQSPDGKIRKVTEYDALGTGSFVQSAHYNIVLNRDKLAEDLIDRNTTEVDLVKCRGGKTGQAGKWYYEFDKSKCHDLDDWFTANPETYKR